LVASEELELKIYSMLPRIQFEILGNHIVPAIEKLEVDQMRDPERYEFVKICFWALSNILGSKIFAEQFMHD